MVDDYRKRRKTADPDAQLLGTGRRGATGAGDFEPDEWAPEDELERGGMLADGARRTRVWTRAVALLVAIAFLLPLAISAIRLVFQ